MKLRQRFLTQSILILISTIVITSCFGFIYTYFYNLLNESNATRGLGQTAVVVMERENILYNSEGFTILQIKEMLMNLSVENNYYEYESNRYKINAENFTMEDGSNYRIIILNQIVNVGDYY